MTLPSLFSTSPTFDSGVPLTRTDHVRLGAQLQRVLAVLGDGQWYTVTLLRAAIFARFGVWDPEPSLSAQIRNAKKVKHGAHVIARKRDGNQYWFRLVREAD